MVPCNPRLLALKGGSKVPGPNTSRSAGATRFVFGSADMDRCELRRTHASELRQTGIDVGIISKQLGHSSIATTARYLDHVAPQAVVDAMRARAWKRTAG